LSNPEHGAVLDSANGKYAPWVSLLREDSDYLRRAPAPAYWALAPYYVGQFTETACSLASAVMVVNAGRADRARSAGARLITQASLLETVGSELWRIGVGNDDGHGVGLLQLQELLAASFRMHDLPAADVEAVPLVQRTDDAIDRFRAVLRACEAAAGQFVIANYYMAAVIGRGDYGHFSPIGAYDAARDRVLVMDVYRVELEPYWVPAARLFEGMTTINRADGEPRGYLTVRLAPS
jgi:Phytochelatin synthase